MAQLIDKDALAAEIKRFRKNNEPKENMQYAQFALDVACGYDMALDDIEAFIDTLEVKRVDLDEEFDKYCDNLYLIDLENEPYAELFECAKHFFELGLNAQKGE